ncbi:hypothetical protein PGIGA_G00102920, partial [Pangasianodon gigas]|nr:hypothetical protein [Pangasianodon gigas]
MESGESRLCSFTKPPHSYSPTSSQLCGDVRTEAHTDSVGGTSGSVGDISPMDQQKYIKKEEPEAESYVCEATSGSMEDITPVDEQKYIKQEEPEDEDYLCGGTSSSVENVDQQREGFQSMHVKDE